jgi:urocanate hydratase
MSTDVPVSEQVPRSIERLLDLLEIVLAEPGCTLTAVAATAELTPTTALRYLRALEIRGYLERDEQGRFHSGATLQRIAAALHDEDPLSGLVTAAQPHLHALATSTGESVYLVVSDGRTATYVATAESARAIRHVGWVGQNVPLDGTAAGAAFAKPGTVVVRTGAVEPDITAISLALDGHDTLDIAISIVGPDQRLRATDRQHAIVELVRTAKTFSAELGFDSSLVSTIEHNEVA